MANEHPPEQKEEKKPGMLESIIDDVGGMAKKTAQIGTVLGLPFIYNLFAPSYFTEVRNYAYATSAGHAVANLMQKKPALEGIVKESAIGTALGGALGKGFEGLNSLENYLAPTYGVAAAKAAKVGAWAFVGQPAFVVTHTALTHGIGEKFKKTIWPSIKDVFKYLALPSAINVGLLSGYGTLVQMTVSGALSFVFGAMQAYRGGEGNFKNLFSELNPFSYAGAAVTTTGKLAKNVVYGLREAVYAIGSSLTDYTKSTPRLASPTPAPAPAN